MDRERFAAQWFSQKNGNYQTDVQEWIHQSYSNPVVFWKEIVEEEPSEALNATIPFVQYNFYRDCIERRLETNKSALKVFYEGDSSETWTYRDIHDLVEAQIGLWVEEFHMVAGQAIALAMPYGIEFLVALMAALKLGLIVCPVPIRDRFVSRDCYLAALEVMKPDWIAISSKNEEGFEKNPNILFIDLTIKKRFDFSIDSHAYAMDSPLFKNYDFFHADDGKSRLVSANEGYLYTLRDGLLAFNLDPGAIWCSPLSSLYYEEPYCTMAALMAGAARAYIAAETLLANPLRLKEESIGILGVSDALLQLWTRKPGCPSSKLKLWYRSPLLGNVQKWLAFSQLNELQKIPCSSLWLDKNRGGVVLFSQPKSAEEFRTVYPSLGVPWSLVHLNGSGEKMQDFGILHIETSPSDNSPITLASVGGAWIVHSCPSPRREGHPYPVEQVEKILLMLDFVLACAVVPEHNSQDPLNSRIAVLIFVEPKKEPLISIRQEEWDERICHKIQKAIGEAYLPDRTLFYGIYPPIKEKKIDKKWILQQYANGLLFSKQKHPLYKHLNLLRQSIYEKLAL